MKVVIPKSTVMIMDGTIYVIDASFSKTAKETVQDKLKKVILANVKLPENEQESGG